MMNQYRKKIWHRRIEIRLEQCQLLAPHKTSAAGGAGRKCFTLIELLVVIAIIAIMAAMLLPALSKTKETAVSSSCINNLKQYGVGINIYSTDSSGFFPLMTQNNNSDSFGTEMIMKMKIITKDGVRCPGLPLNKSPKGSFGGERYQTYGCIKHGIYEIFPLYAVQTSTNKIWYIKAEKMKAPSMAPLAADSSRYDKDGGVAENSNNDEFGVVCQARYIADNNPQMMMHFRHSKKANALMADNSVLQGQPVKMMQHMRACARANRPGESVGIHFRYMVGRFQCARVFP